jgi:hypothetical protein
LDIPHVRCYVLHRMTAKQTATAVSGAQPKEGEVLIYIDWQGKRIYGKPTHQPATKKGEKE